MMITIIRASGVSLVLFGLTACGSPGEAPAPEPTPELRGSIVGTVTFVGDTVPANEPIPMDADPYCGQFHTETVMTRGVIVDDGGGLKNAFVYIREGIDGSRYPIPETPVTLDHRGCMYHPHVLGVRVGQPVRILYNDETLHNLHTMSRYDWYDRAAGVPVTGLTTERTFTHAEVMIPFRCDVHKWMKGYLGVLPHPFFVVTDSGGRFVFESVPPGEYVVEAWQETFGIQEHGVTVEEERAAEITFGFTE